MPGPEEDERDREREREMGEGKERRGRAEERDGRTEGRRKRGGEGEEGRREEGMDGRRVRGEREREEGRKIDRWIYSGLPWPAQHVQVALWCVQCAIRKATSDTFQRCTPTRKCFTGTRIERRPRRNPRGRPAAASESALR